MTHRTPSELDLRTARDVTKRVLAAGGEHIERVVLFGSRARGLARSDSDLDMLALVDRATAGLSRRLQDAVTDYLYERGFDIDVELIVLPSSGWRERLQIGAPFQREVEREGIELWTPRRAA